MTIEIETSRLLLKQMEPIDAEGLFEMNSDPAVIKYTGDVLFTDIGQARDFISHYDDYDKYGCGRLSTFIKETQEYIGWCGLRYLSKKGKTDIGYRFIKRYWGKGYATEAAEACIKNGFTRLNLDSIIATAMKENIASINVFNKLGLKYTFDEDCGCQPGVVYTITRQEWNRRLKIKE